MESKTIELLKQYPLTPEESFRMKASTEEIICLINMASETFQREGFKMFMWTQHEQAMDMVFINCIITDEDENVVFRGRESMSGSLMPINLLDWESFIRKTKAEVTRKFDKFMMEQCEEVEI